MHFLFRDNAIIEKERGSAVYGSTIDVFGVVSETEHDSRSRSFERSYVLAVKDQRSVLPHENLSSVVAHRLVEYFEVNPLSGRQRLESCGRMLLRIKSRPKVERQAPFCLWMFNE